MDKITAQSSNTLLKRSDSINGRLRTRLLNPMKQKLMPREALARNVKHLMSIHNQSEEDLAKISGVSQKTINNVVNQRTATSLDNIEKLAAAWGLTGWQLIIPSLPDELIGSGRIAKIYQNYVGSSPDGRKHIEMVAEREAAYTVNKQDK